MKKISMKDLDSLGIEIMSRENLKMVNGGANELCKVDSDCSEGSCIRGRCKCRFTCEMEAGGTMPCCQSSGSACIDLYDNMGLTVSGCWEVIG